MRQQIVALIMQWQAHAQAQIQHLIESKQELNQLTEFRDMLRAQYFWLRGKLGTNEHKQAHRQLFELVTVIRHVDILISDRKGSSELQRSTFELAQRIASAQLRTPLSILLGESPSEALPRYGLSSEARLLASEWVEYHPALFTPLPEVLLESSEHAPLGEILHYKELPKLPESTALEVSRTTPTKSRTQLGIVTPPGYLH